MSSLAFHSILAQLQQGLISEADARQQLARLKADAARVPTAKDDQAHLEIAVIGMAGQFPGADSVAGFWHNLEQGLDGVAELGERYLDRRRYSPERQPGKTYCKWGGTLEHRDDFDPLFFNISPREAESMNPHQRLILQEGWKALEDAGYDPRSLRNRAVGLYVGAEPTGYFHETFIGASDAIIASRLAYVLDFKGPALVVNTGCSSSAVAIHLACESLRTREADMALAGGVFASLGERSLVSLAQMDMLSPSGRCHTFDQRSDGIVLSEAVGMLVLKRLPDALADGDPIHGVICASGMNQDGASNGITAPSGQAQERLIGEVYRRFGIDPRRIGYVEAHGTGTPLGDPVEVNALARAFRGFTPDTGYCALGSAKAHIGHASAAAGVVSLIKVLLSMKHRRLPGLLHYEALNPRIELAGSAFHIDREPRDWSAADGEPLIAALNSFGHSGTNVHLVLREAVEAPLAHEAEPSCPLLLTLSARTLESLRRYAGQVRDALGEGSLRPLDLVHTLQVARPALAHRLAVLAATPAELAQHLVDWLEGRPSAQVWQDEAQPGVDTPVALPATARVEDLQRLAECWVVGGQVDWSAFNRQHYPGARRVHAPVYPFARQGFWIPPALRGTAGGDLEQAGEHAPARLHPFLGHNASDLQGIRFRTIFDGEEAVLRQHQVGGQRIFPGVGHLEMARAAVALAAQGHAGGRQPSFSNVVWLRPLVIDETPRQVEVSLSPDEDGRIRFEISSRALDPTGQAGDDAVLHSQGLASFDEATQPRVDLAALQARTARGRLSAAQCYAAYRTMTFEHGPFYQGLQGVGLGHGEVLAEIALPACQHGSLADYYLHPSLMDSALQAAIGLSLGADVVLAESERSGLPSSSRPTLPFALEHLRIWNRCHERMWARVGYAAPRPDQPTDASLQRLDIELFDAEGRLCVALQGFTSRVLGQPDGEAPGAPAPARTLLFQPDWRDEAPIPGEAAGFDERIVLLSGFDERTTADLRQRDPGCRWVSLDAPEDDPAEDYRHTALALLQRLRPLASQGGRRLLQLVVLDPRGQRLVSGLAAMLRSLRQEAPGIHGQVIEMDEPGSLARRLEGDAAQGDAEIRYREGRRQVLHWQLCPAMDLAIAAPWKARGVYLITGGLGGLGQVFARAIAAGADDATLVLTGRSPGDSQALDDLGGGRACVEYRQVDVSERAAVDTLVAQVLAQHGRLDGVLHCAGAIRDSLLPNKRDDDLEQVMAAKVAGARNLDLATAELPLDFLIFFASGTGVVGNAGQADYAAANAFLDRYATYRQRLVAEGRRSGHSLAIDWPLWKEGGMRVDEATAQRMADATGMLPMPTNAGVHALRQCIALGLPQVLVMHGHAAPLTALVCGTSPAERSAITPSPRPEPARIEAPAADAPDEDTLRRRLTELVARQMKIPAEDIRADAEFSQYGFDSISLTTLANTLKQQWRLNLAPTIFFEHPTIARFSGYLAREHGEALGALAAPARVAAAKPMAAPVADRSSSTSTTPSALVERRSRAGHEPVGSASGDDDIVVIGVSGRFPMADDVEQFFHNLRDGRDCISEVPGDRWDWRAYYGDPHREADKTNVKWGGFIRGVDHFDPLFFGISPREAQLMDPQQRLLMTYAWLAIEDAGYATADLAGSDTGVFIGTGVTGYSSLIAKTGVPIEGYSATAMVPSVGPNRMSFLLDLHGPSEPVETACSSSLVAIHRAVQAMRGGDCRMAIVGGVNTLIAPEAQISFSKAGMLALDGRSKTFSAQANGYARGEGVGMLVLKTRRQAEADGDHIYGVIRSTVENHGGKANSLTAPNPRAQADLLKAAYRQAGVDPRSVGYVEAHGTGTELGDPIEINGLKMAFRELAQEQGLDDPGQGYCGVGSVKSNVGHLELAAGVAGVIKVLLQLKHRTLFKSLHCEQLNPYIELEHSPFYIVQQSRPWPAPQDREGNALPRRAGVSSFGFGGANAHILLEEYQPVARGMEAAHPGLRAFPLSAKTAERLRVQARRLGAFLADRPAEAQAEPERYLDDLAFTLQVGRDAMDERVALLSDSLDDLQRQLVAFAEEGEATYQGRRDGDPAALALFRQDEDMASALAAWIDKRKYSKLLALWCQGLEIDWRAFHRDGVRQRLSLPGYPFAEDRYWVTDLAGARPAVATRPAWLHPLLERNTSDFYQQRFSSRWLGTESWFVDHQVGNRKILPGVAYLEMARAAIARSWDPQVLARGTLCLRNVVWLTPHVVEAEGRELHLELILEQQAVDFRFSSDDASGAVEHCKGRAEIVVDRETPVLDLAVLSEGPWLRSLDAAELYDVFEGLGIHYGPAHRGVERLWLGEDHVLARLALAPATFGSDWLLHPGMLDSAVQASVGLLLRHGDEPGDTRLPFALERLEAFGACQPVMWALIRAERRSPDRSVQRIDIELCDEQGRVVVALRGFSSRPLAGDRDELRADPTDAHLPAGLTLLAPRWSPLAATLARPEGLSTLVIGAGAEHRGWLAELHPEIEFLPALASTQDGIATQLAACAPYQRLIWVAPPASADPWTAPAQDEPLVVSLFRLVKVLIQRHAGDALHFQAILTASVGVLADGGPSAEQAACHGLLGSLAREHETWRVETIDLPAGTQPLPTALPVQALPGECLAWRGGEWFQQRLLPLVDSPSAAVDAMPYREGGVYLVIGGAGGIGEVWTRHLMAHYRAQVVWLGRRPLDDGIAARLETLAAFGRRSGAPAPVYVQADAADDEQLARARRQVLDGFGPVNGVVHSALVLDDARLARMDEARFRAGLDAKRATSLALARVFDPAHNPELDRVLFFSSMVAFSRAAGQGNYAAGCTFTDALAERLGRCWPCRVNVINWGYWGSVGVVANPGHRARMTEAGMGSIEPEEGMASLERLLALPLGQAGLVKLLEPQAIAGIDATQALVCGPGESRAYPTWSDVVAGLPRPAPPEGAETLDRLLLARVFACLGALANEGPLTEQRIAANPVVATALAARPFYRRWLRESLRRLSLAGSIDREGHPRAPIPDEAAAAAAWSQARDAWDQDDDVRAQVRLVDACIAALPAILRGERQATDVMFPGGSMDAVEGVYKHNRVSDHFNAAVCALVLAVLQHTGSDRPLRILEIGAGTGGTTAGLIEAMAPWHDRITEYCFTDISQAFLQHARQRFAAAPYLRTARFDVSRPATEQGIEQGAYDLVIATNVLHATPDLRQTLRNAKATLGRGGLLLLNEISRPSLFTHLTFGLLEGWWLYDDEVLRMEGGPGVYPERWLQLLQAEGFVDVAFPLADSHALGQQIVVAASDGTWRRSLAPRQDQGALPAPVPLVKAPEGASAVHPVEPEHDADLTKQCRRMVTETLSALVNLPIERLQGHVGFDRYGIDSILQISLIQRLEQTVGELSRTILFDYNTIDQLTDYLVSEHRSALARQFDRATSPTPTFAATAPVSLEAPLRAARHGPAVAASTPHEAPVTTHAPAPTPLRTVDSDIAIIGVAGRYPRATELEQFWDNLQAGRNCIGEAPSQRWAASLTGSERWAQARYFGGFLDEVTGFDHRLFGLDEEQAANLSPELRQMLEVSWRTFEDAGYSREALGRLQAREGAGVGVFIGSMYHQSPWAERSLERAAIKSNVTDWQIPNRISHCFDLRGPSLAVNSACSSSMTAIHLACQSLLQRDCAMALAGGVNLILDPSKYETLRLAQYLGSSDLSRALGQGDGMIPGEGAGAVLLKPLTAALADGDRVLGVIKGSSANHGGGRLMYSAPDTRQQAALIAAALQRAGLAPAQIDCVEAAANGSELGDPIEVAALKKVFGNDRPGQCVLGTVKSNIGHLEAASGISQLTKVLLQLRHRQLSPTINAEPLNPHIRLEGSAFRLQDRAAPWPEPTTGEPRRCLINSFGAGGSYASLVIEEAPAPAVLAARSGGPYLLVFSAASRSSLLGYLQRLEAMAEAGNIPDLGDLAFSLAQRECHMAHRLALVLDDPVQLAERLRAAHRAEPLDGCWRSAPEGVDADGSDMASGSLSEQAAAYCQGARLDLQALFARGQRLPLPGYVFDRDTPDGPVQGASAPAFDDRLYRQITRGELSAEHFERLITAH